AVVQMHAAARRLADVRGAGVAVITAGAGAATVALDADAVKKAGVAPLTDGAVGAQALPALARRWVERQLPARLLGGAGQRRQADASERDGEPLVGRL